MIIFDKLKNSLAYNLFGMDLHHAMYDHHDLLYSFQALLFGVCGFVIAELS